MINSKCLVTIFELKKNQINESSKKNKVLYETIFSEKSKNFINNEQYSTLNDKINSISSIENENYKYLLDKINSLSEKSKNFINNEQYSTLNDKINSISSIENENYKYLLDKINSSFMTKNELNNKLILYIYIKTVSIKVNINENINENNGYFINKDDNKLYKYDINGTNPQLANGNFLIAISNDSNLVNQAYKVLNGIMEQLYTYFDGSNLKLIINKEEITTEGMLILTNDYKIFVRIGNSWFGK
jgi:hypothetical protein